MRTTLSTRHFDASEKLLNFAQSEFNKIDRLADQEFDGKIELEENGNLKTVNLNLKAYGKVLVSRVEGADFYKIIPKCVDKIEKQLKSVKSKVYNRS